MKKDFQQFPSTATPMPYSVESVGDLPRSLQQAASHVLELTDRPLSIFVIPATTRLKNWYGWERAPEQALLFTDDGVAHLQAISPEDARSVYLKAADLRSTCLSLKLMNGRLELVDDCLSRVVVEFNAGGFELLQPGLQILLLSSCKGSSIPPSPIPLAETILEDIEKISYKYRNGLALYGLLPGEQLLGFVYQPAIWKKRWGLFSSKVTDATLLATTDKQLIVVEQRSNSRFPAYGWIFTFCPRTFIRTIGISSHEPWRELRIEMCMRAGFLDKSILLEQQNTLAWQDLWLRFGQPDSAG